MAALISLPAITRRPISQTTGSAWTVGRHTGCSSLFKSSLNRKGREHVWKRTYCCVECGLVVDRDENSAVNILMRFLARREPHMERISMRCADVFTAIEGVLHTFEHI